jgi:hypothetical protein
LRKNDVEDILLDRHPHLTRGAYSMSNRFCIHETFRPVGIFLGGLGILLAGIALLIIAIRPPLCHVGSVDSQTASEPFTPESALEEMNRIMRDPQMQAAIDKLMKNAPVKQEVKTEIRKVP